MSYIMTCDNNELPFNVYGSELRVAFIELCMITESKLSFVFRSALLVTLPL